MHENVKKLSYYPHQHLFGIIYFSIFWKLFIFYREKYVFVASSLQNIKILSWLRSQLDKILYFNLPGSNIKHSFTGYFTFYQAFIYRIFHFLSSIHLQDISLFYQAFIYRIFHFFIKHSFTGYFIFYQTCFCKSLNSPDLSFRFRIKVLPGVWLELIISPGWV